MNIDKEIQEAFTIEVGEMGFCLDQQWGEFENPYVNDDTALAYNLFKKGWLASNTRHDKKLEDCVVVPKDQIETWWQDAKLCNHN
ncbi:hypothetical protein [Acinetobacter dispersus]|uniref:Uncharacterized protein n=1 Tax=Acinetobacter dispersus TaxID=70348 RepID=N9MRE6_9GAMM|nr:hypothetical protein [Acinetobacter dispersus]ENW93341.1 hypothetical protein F904_01465 [Acinetobacter dispersus]